jgi:hypothetical protein
MSRVRSITLIALTTCGLSIISIPAASAEGPFWINKAKAKISPTAIEKIVAKNVTPYILKGKAGGAAVEIECIKQTSKLANIRNLEEGIGVGEGTLEFTECNVKAPLNCAVTTPIRAKVRVQLVGSEKGVEERKGKILALAGAKRVNNIITTIEFKNIACPLNGLQARISGGVAAEITPAPGVVAKTVKLKLIEAAKTLYWNTEEPAAEEFTELNFGGEKATLSGESELELTSKEEFGVEY